VTLWVMRAGRYGERESFALENDVAVVGWDEVPDLSSLSTRPSLQELLEKCYPEAKAGTIRSWVGQLFAFVREVRAGDLVALPLKARPAIAFGEVKGPYKFSAENPPGARHVRAVEWIREVPRGAIDQDIRFSLGSAMTVCKVQRNQAEERIRSLLSGRSSTDTAPVGSTPTDSDSEFDVVEVARDQVRSHIARRFAGQALAELVAELLRTDGCETRVSPAGPDGGVDILAGRGPLGFDAPRLAVQVKSGEAPMDIKVVRELQGVMKNFGAEHGLFVAWGGFKDSVRREAARLFFEIRLWDANDLVEQIEQHYDQLSESTQAALPLKRVWALEVGEEEG